MLNRTPSPEKILHDTGECVICGGSAIFHDKLERLEHGVPVLDDCPLAKSDLNLVWEARTRLILWDLLGTVPESVGLPHL